MEKKVNLFIVGAMKAGTTSFVNLLSQHPNVYVSPLKEPHYFIDILPSNLYEESRFFNLDNYFENDFPKPRHIAKVEKQEHYEKLFSLTDNQKYRAEASTAYLHAPESARLIYNYNPSAKIIIILREPINRSYSHYQMDLGLGRETKSFTDLIKKEVDAYHSQKLPWNSYLAMSFYNTPISRYRELFKDVMVLHFEDVMNNWEETAVKLSQFLGIEEFSNIVTDHKNETKNLRYQKLFYILKRLGLKDFFSEIFSNRFRQWIFRKVSTNKKRIREIPNQLKEELNHIFTLESNH